LPVVAKSSAAGRRRPNTVTANGGSVTASAGLDQCYFGPNLTGTTAGGYGQLIGAKPMTED